MAVLALGLLGMLALLSLCSCLIFSQAGKLRALGAKLGAAEEHLRQQAEALSEAEAKTYELKELLRKKPAPSLVVAHELRAPVAAIQQSLDVILQGHGTGNSAVIEEMLRLARDRAAAMLAMVNDLLYLGDAQRAELEGQMSPVDVADVLWRVAPEMRIKATLRQVELRLEAPSDLPLIEASQEHIEELLSNLMDNAIKYTNPGGYVTVTLKDGCDCLVGEVADSGIGIPPEEMPHIFDEFYRGKNAKEVEPYGTGLGLPLVKRIVELYSGHLEVESEVGGGSRFVFTFPKSGGV